MTATLAGKLRTSWARWRSRPASPIEIGSKELWSTVTPIWAMLVAGQVSYYALLRLQFPDTIPRVSADAILGLLLLPPMVLGCLVVLKTWRRSGVVSAALVALATGLAFGALARPAYELALVIDPLTSPQGTFAEGLVPDDPRGWVLWMANVVEYLVLYLSCAAAAVGFLSYRGLMNERLLRSQVESRAVYERLRALRTQLNPHFLYNALNGIVSLSEQSSESAEDLVSHLSDLLRRTLAASESEEHSLSEEAAYAEAYLSVQRIRHPSRVRWTMDIGSGCSHLRVPTLILQPLIENAVIHGLRGNATDLDIRIEARRRSDQLLLAVSNASRMPKPLPSTLRQGFGLRHVRERLSVLFGDRAGVVTDRPQPHLFRVQLWLPISGGVRLPTPETVANTN